MAIGKTQKLILNDGSELPGHVIETDGYLYVYLDNSTLTNAVRILNKPEKTEKITADNYGEITEYTGYNHLKAVSEERDGMVSCVLRKEVNG